MVITTKTRQMVVHLITTHRTTITLAFITLPHDISIACFSQSSKTLHQVWVLSEETIPFCTCGTWKFWSDRSCCYPIPGQITWKQIWLIICRWLLESRLLHGQFVVSVFDLFLRLWSGCQLPVWSIHAKDVWHLYISTVLWHVLNSVAIVCLVCALLFFVYCSSLRHDWRLYVLHYFNYVQLTSWSLHLSKWNIIYLNERSFINIYACNDIH